MVMMEYLLSPRGILKVCHMLFTLIALGTWFGIFNYWGDFVTGTIFLSFFASICIFVQNMILAPSRVTEILLSGVLCLFFFVSGILVLVYYSKFPVGDACGAFCFFACIVYGVDVYFAFSIETE